jgi:hypothetical protein
MSWMDQISNVLQNYSNNSAPSESREVADHYNQVAQAAPATDLASSLAAMFRSDQTPAFPQLVSQLFGNSNNNQRATLLNALMTSGAGAGILSQLAKSAGISLPTGATAGPITPDEASRISPEMVQHAAAHAETHDPSIVDRISAIYAEHPALINTLGAAAMSMAMSHLASRRR